MVEKFLIKLCDLFTYLEDLSWTGDMEVEEMARKDVDFDLKR